MPTNKFIQASHLVGSALRDVDPQQNQGLWKTLQALRGLIGELQADTDQMQKRLDQFEAAVPKKES